MAEEYVRTDSVAAPALAECCGAARKRVQESTVRFYDPTHFPYRTRNIMGVRLLTVCVVQTARCHK